MLLPLYRRGYVCAHCLRRARRQQRYSTSAPPAPPPASGAAKLQSRRLISLHGSEVPKFLQGIITNSIRPESPSGVYSAFLNAQGRVLRDVFLYPTNGTQWHKEVNQDDEPGYLIELDGEGAEGLLRHLKKHKLRSKFKLRLLDEGELDVWSVWREEERWTAHGQQSGGQGGNISLTDCRAPGMGQRLLLPHNSGDRGILEEVEQAPPSAYTIRRYLRGVPEGQREIPAEDSLPMNCNIDIMGGIDFKKGCYVGQELTIRTHHTGVVRRRLLPVLLYGRGDTPPDSLQYRPDNVPEFAESDIRRDDKRRRPTGKLVANLGNVGLGMCRLEQMTDLTVSGEGSSFSADDKFLVTTNTGEEFGVKAFVPDWFRGRVREPKVQKRVSD